MATKILIIQTAFLGDVVLATPLLTALRQAYPAARIDFLLRKGNETLLQDHPQLTRVWVWDKQQHKYRHWWQLLRAVRKERYEVVITLQRFAAMGLFAVLSGAQCSIGFSKNPFSFAFTYAFPHEIGTPEQPVHEVTRNLSLLTPLLSPPTLLRPQLYPSAADYAATRQASPYICVAPSSVWFTKQLPVEKWIALLEKWEHVTVFLLGATSDFALCERIRTGVKNPTLQIRNQAGAYTLLQSAALMQYAQMNYVNDSAPLHLASAMNAPVTAFYCSTVPYFGFTPLSDLSIIKEITMPLACRPCGLAGKAACPQGHFACSEIAI